MAVHDCPEWSPHWPLSDLQLKWSVRKEPLLSAWRSFRYKSLKGLSPGETHSPGAGRAGCHGNRHTSVADGRCIGATGPQSSISRTPRCLDPKTLVSRCCCGSSTASLTFPQQAEPCVPFPPFSCLLGPLFSGDHVCLHACGLCRPCLLLPPSLLSPRKQAFTCSKVHLSQPLPTCFEKVPLKQHMVIHANLSTREASAGGWQV